MIADDRRQSVYGQLRSLPRRRTADERSDRRQRVPAVAAGDRVDGGGCPLCGCGRAPAGDAAAAAAAADRRRSRTSKLAASSNCDDDVAAERRRKRALLRKLRRFSDAFYGNSGDVQLKTFGHF